MEGILQALLSIVAAIKNKYTLDVESWIPVTANGNPQPSFMNGWLNYGTPFNNAEFYKDPLGVVHLRGLIKNGTLNTVAFVLPAGYRPVTTYMFWQCSFLGSYISARIDIGATGNVLITTQAGNGFISLDGITFKAEA